MTTIGPVLRVLLCLLPLVVFPAGIVHAVTPDEMLKDPALESRARSISGELRCMVCQNESIDDSNSELAHDLRVLVRERLQAGDDDRQVMDFIVARYGEFVLLKPRFNARNALLWGTPLLVLLGGLALAWSTMRRRRNAAPQGLTREEEERLKRVLDEDG